jgi:hypothetical protein
MGPCAYISTCFETEGDPGVDAVTPKWFDIQYIVKRDVHYLHGFVMQMLDVDNDDEFTLWRVLRRDQMEHLAVISGLESLEYVIETHTNSSCFGYLYFG